MNICLCYPDEALKHEPVKREWKGDTVWATYPPCPEHGESFVSAEWNRRYGRLNDKTASACPLAVS